MEGCRNDLQVGEHSAQVDSSYTDLLDREAEILERLFSQE
jgi:hypothetical protein